MADNVVANAGSGGSTFAADDIGSVLYPRAKIVWGPDGTANDTDVASGKPLPIQLRDASGNALPLPAALAANGGFKIEGVASGVAVPVSLATVPSHAVTNAGTFAVQVPAVSTTSTVSSVNDAATSQTLLASNANRKAYKFYNDSTVTAYVKEGTTATTSDYSYQIASGGFYEYGGHGVYTGRIDCIWASDASGAMKITEIV